MWEEVENVKGKPVTTADEAKRAMELGLDPIRQWNELLNEFLESYTKGTARGIVDACG